MAQIIFLIVIANLPVAGAEAACSPTVSVDPIVAASYDPFEPLAETSTLAFEIDNRGGDTCTISLSIRTENGAPPPFAVGAKGLSFDLAPVNAGTAFRRIEPGRFDIEVAADAVETKLFDLAPVTGVMENAGYHEAFLVADVVFPETGAQILDKRLIRFSVEVIARAQLTVSGSDASFESAGSIRSVNFGVLNAGDTRRLYLVARSTAQGTLFIQSENGGAMLINGDRVRSAVPYTFRLNGSPVDLSSSAQFTVMDAQTIRGVSMPVEIEIGNTDGAIAGSYSDLINVQFTVF